MNATAGPLRATALVELGNALRRLRYRFITPTPATHALVNARPENQAARDLYDVLGWSRPFAPDDPAVLPPPLRTLLADAGMLLVDEAGGSARSALRVSTIDQADGDPLLFFHSAFPTIAADDVFFGPDSYRFLRQLAATVPSLEIAPKRCVDIGCGAGVGAVLLARLLPAATVHAVDINPAALTMTTVNAALAGVVNVVPQHSDLLSALDGSFDLIIANPPYLVDVHERRYRHGGGALGGALSLAIVDAAIARLAPGGTLLLYTASAIVRGIDALHDAAGARLDQAGLTWRYEEIDPDVFSDELNQPAYAHADRIAAVWLSAVKPRRSPR
jgi:methylase of polypeptide subunit release factors